MRVHEIVLSYLKFFVFQNSVFPPLGSNEVKTFPPPIGPGKLSIFDSSGTAMQDVQIAKLVASNL